MKHYTGDDHRRLSWQRPPLQPVDMEVLHSNEHRRITAVFGTSSPPSGLSGIIRRYAFRYSECSWRHWIPLILADRINVVEGIIDDLAHGYIPNIFAERGWAAEWKCNRAGFVRKAAIGLAVTGALAYLLLRKKQKRSWLAG